MLHDHRLVRARSERLARPEQHHRRHEGPEAVGEREHRERKQVRSESQHHRASPPGHVRYDACGDLQQVDGNLTHGDQRAELRVVEALLDSEEQQQERLEEAQVLQEPVRGELQEHQLL